MEGGRGREGGSQVRHRNRTGFVSGDVFTVEVQNLSLCWNVYFRAQQDYMINLQMYLLHVAL